MRSTFNGQIHCKKCRKWNYFNLGATWRKLFQHKSHFNSLLEVKIADKYLSWGNVKSRKIVPGVIKNLKKIIKLEQNNFRSEIAKDIMKLKLQRLSRKSKYLKDLYDFFSLIKDDKLIKKLLVKLHPVKSFGKKKAVFVC